MLPIFSVTDEMNPLSSPGAEVVSSSPESSKASRIGARAVVVSSIESLKLLNPELMALKPDWKKVLEVVEISSVIVVGSRVVLAIVAGVVERVEVTVAME